MVAMKDIQQWCDAVAVAFKPQRIILFGSHAYGQPHEESDVDVLVVMPKARRWWSRAALKIRQHVSPGFPVDVLVRDPSFIEERLREGDTFLEEITGKGRLMYESRHA